MNLVKVGSVVLVAAGLGLSGCATTGGLTPPTVTTNPQLAAEIAAVTAALKYSCSTFVPLASTIADVVIAAYTKDPSVLSDKGLATTLAKAVCAVVSAGPVATTSLHRGGSRVLVFGKVMGVPVKGYLKH